MMYMLKFSSLFLPFTAIGLLVVAENNKETNQDYLQRRAIIMSLFPHLLPYINYASTNLLDNFLLKNRAYKQGSVERSRDD